MTEDELAGELRALGRTLVVAPPADDLVERVLSRVADEPAAARTRSAARARGARRRRVVAVVVALLLLGLGLTPPVRAAVVEWLRIGGVLVRTAPPAAGPSPTPSPPPTGSAVTLAEARAQVSFPVGVPAELGPPDRVSVSADRRVVGMDWGSGPERLHLDQFDGELSWVFVKQTRDRFEVTAVGGRDAVWFPTAHQIGYVDTDGRERTEQARTAGPCLVWERPVAGRLVTLRLEGDQPRARAVAIAESVR